MAALLASIPQGASFSAAPSRASLPSGSAAPLRLAAPRRPFRVQASDQGSSDAGQPSGPRAATRREAVLGAMAAAASTSIAAAAPAWAAQSAGDWSSPGLNQQPEIDIPFQRTESGAAFQEVYVGQGRVAAMGDLVEIDYVLRRSNGYFVYGTVEGVGFQPKDVPTGPVYYRLGETKLIKGMEEVLVGMQAGGKRRALIPPRLGYAEDASLQPQPPGFGPKRQIAQHKTENLLFEVQVIKVVA